MATFRSLRDANKKSDLIYVSCLQRSIQYKHLLIQHVSINWREIHSTDAVLCAVNNENSRNFGGRQIVIFIHINIWDFIKINYFDFFKHFSSG